MCGGKPKAKSRKELYPLKQIRKYRFQAALFLILELGVVVFCAALHHFLGWFSSGSSQWRTVAYFQIASLGNILFWLCLLSVARFFWREKVDALRLAVKVLWVRAVYRLSGSLIMFDRRPFDMLVCMIAVVAEMRHFAPPGTSDIKALIMAGFFGSLLVMAGFVAYTRATTFFSERRSARRLEQLRAAVRARRG
jgi:hypothetical protein